MSTRLKAISTLFFCLLIEGCQKDISFSECLIREVQVSYDKPFALYTYVNDGARYTKVSWKYYDQNTGLLSDNGAGSMDLSYDNKGRLSVVYEGTTERHFSYIGNKIVEMFPTQADTIATYLAQFPNDTSFVVEPSVPGSVRSLCKVEEGNLTKIAIEDSAGFEAFGSKWKYQTYFYYDDKPNVIKDYAIGILITGAWRSSKNNIVKTTVFTRGTDSYEVSQSFEWIQNQWPRKYTYGGTGRSAVFTCDCK